MERYRIDEHPLWASHILPLLFTNGSDPRERIEVREPSTLAVRLMLLTIEIRCVACGRWMKPIRERKTTAPEWGSSVYLTVACAPDVKRGCSRGNAATVEASRLKEHIHGWKDPRQPSLFDAGSIT